MHRRQLPIVRPCHESWEEMTGDGAVRHCDSCDELVHDLSAMSQDEARVFVREQGREQPCIRYRFDAAGRLLFAAALSVAVGGCMGKMPSSCENPEEPQVATPYEAPSEPSAGVEPSTDQVAPEGEPPAEDQQ